jgi:hypothetical protein
MRDAAWQGAQHVCREPVRRLLNLIGVSSVHVGVDQAVQTARGYRLAVTAG